MAIRAATSNPGIKTRLAMTHPLSAGTKPMQHKSIAERRKGRMPLCIVRVLPWVLALLVALPVVAGEMTQVAGLIRAPLPVIITPPGSEPVTLEAMVTRPARADILLP